MHCSSSSTASWSTSTSMASSFAAVISLPNFTTKSKAFPIISKPYRNHPQNYSFLSFNTRFSIKVSIFPSSSVSPTTIPSILHHQLSGGKCELNSVQLPIDRRTLIWAFILGAVGFVSCFLACGHSVAAVASAASNDSIRASGFGLKVATELRKFGWADEAVVFALAALPVLELRGAIPVGYWMQLQPVQLTLLSLLGNMVPVPFIILYLKRLAKYVSQKSESATRFLDLIFQRAREKASPVEEFQWLGLMLFVAVPFPGTGAWTGAIIASILDMPFWSAVSANFVGVLLAGLLVNLIVNLGLKYAIIVGILLFFVSTGMWSVLRYFKKALSPK